MIPNAQTVEKCLHLFGLLYQNTIGLNNRHLLLTALAVGSPRSRHQQAPCLVTGASQFTDGTFLLCPPRRKGQAFSGVFCRHLSKAPPPQTTLRTRLRHTRSVGDTVGLYVAGRLGRERLCSRTWHCFNKEHRLSLGRASIWNILVPLVFSMSQPLLFSISLRGQMQHP